MEDDLLDLTRQARSLIEDALDLIVTAGGPLSREHIIAVSGLLALASARTEEALSCAGLLFDEDISPDFGIVREDE